MAVQNSQTDGEQTSPKKPRPDWRLDPQLQTPPGEAKEAKVSFGIRVTQKVVKQLNDLTIQHGFPSRTAFMLATALELKPENIDKLVTFFMHCLDQPWGNAFSDFADAEGISAVIDAVQASLAKFKQHKQDVTT
jgi:hypothetical protein